MMISNTIRTTPWWVEYRRQQYKPRPALSMQMIMRKIFFQVLMEYMRNCSIAGIKYLIDPKINWKWRCVWTISLSSLFSLVCYYLIFTWLTTLANPLILMPQYATYSISNIDYPAVALCNVNRISMKAMKRKALIFYENHILGNITLEQIEEFLVNFGRLLDFSYIDTLGAHFSTIEQFAQRHGFDTHMIVNAMKELAPNCKEMLLRCSWAGQQVDCMSIFRTRRTARGHCCAFNYILDFDEHGHPNRTFKKAMRQLLPGFVHGLNVILDPMLHDYAYPLNYVKGFDVLLFQPTHFADPSAGGVVHRFAEPNRLEFLELKSIKQTASPEMRKYPRSTRKCMFQDEKSEDFHELYSYSACIVRCRVKSVLSLCQCTPYFLPMAKEDGPICLLSDLQCLNKYKEKLSHLQPINSHQHEDIELEDSLQCSDCLADCEHTRHQTKSYKTSINTYSVDKYFTYGFVQGINMTDKCILSIYYSNPGGNLERLDIVSYWYQIVSNIGGFSGVLIGISVFSFVEIVYFFVLRFSQEVYKKYMEQC